MSKIPSQLRTSIGALLVLTGLGGGTYYVDQAATAEVQKNQYIQAVAADPDMPDGMRIAMSAVNTRSHLPPMVLYLPSVTRPLKPASISPSHRRK